MKEVLELSAKLLEAMNGLSLHLQVGAHPTGAKALLEQWEAAHQAIAVTNNELNRLADTLAGSVDHTISRIR